MNKVGQYWKAIMGFVAPGVVVLGSAVTSGSAGGTNITRAEWISAAVAAFATASAVYVKGNNPAVAEVAGNDHLPSENEVMHND